MSICIAHRTQRIVKFYLDPFVPSLGVCASSHRGLALKTVLTSVPRVSTVTVEASEAP
jgi:hypothetical protein